MRCVNYRVLVPYVAVRFISRDPFLKDGAQLLPIKSCVQFFFPSFFPSPPFFFFFWVVFFSFFHCSRSLLSFSFFHPLRTHWSVARVRFSACHLGPRDGTYSDFCRISQKCYQYKPVFVNKQNLFPDKMLCCCVFEPPIPLRELCCCVFEPPIPLSLSDIHTHTVMVTLHTHAHKHCLGKKLRLKEQRGQLVNLKATHPPTHAHAHAHCTLSFFW